MRRLVSSLLLAALLTGCGATPAVGLVNDGAAFGKSGHGKKKDGERDVLSLVREANAPLAARDAGLIAEKYQRMAEDPFAFFRGTAYLFYPDAQADSGLATAIRIPLQGDFHLENLGTYRTATGAIAYDLNDFDEAATGPYTLELARVAVSIHLAAETSGLKRQAADGLVAGFLAAYQHHVGQLSASALKHPQTDAGRSDEVAEALNKANKTTRPAFLAKLGAGGHFKDTEKFPPADAATSRQIESALTSYAALRREPLGFFKPKGMAKRVAGLASLGRYRYVAWVEGASASPDDDRVLEFKEAAPALLTPTPTAAAAAGRVIDATHYFLPEADPFLGAATLQGRPFVVRELQPAKQSVDLADLRAGGDFTAYLETVALVAARAHARSGRGAAIASELPAKRDALVRFAAAYAETVKADHASFKKSLKK